MSPLPKRLQLSHLEEHIRRRDVMLSDPLQPGDAIRAALARGDASGTGPQAMLDEVKGARLLGRGGAGFTTGVKWESCSRQPIEPRVVVCNADEGEPGTFKDRLLLARYADLVFEGMTVAAYGIGASLGFVYLRGEYRYLLDALNATLERRRRDGLLGRAICGREGFDFDLVMVSAWDPVKRHHALFEALRRLRDRHGRVLRAALVGYPMRWRSERIEASEGDGKQSLIALRDKLLKLTREIDLEMKKRLENAVTLVESILKEEDAQAAIEKHAQEIDEFFSQAVQMEFEKAREENDLARIEKIQKLISVIEKMTAPPAEVEFLQTLLETRDENERARLLDEKIELVNDQFLQTINSIIAEGESHKQSPELLEELKSIYKLALRKSMEKNLKS